MGEGIDEAEGVRRFNRYIKTIGYGDDVLPDIFEGLKEVCMAHSTVLKRIELSFEQYDDGMETRILLELEDHSDAEHSIMLTDKEKITKFVTLSEYRSESDETEWLHK